MSYIRDTERLEATLPSIRTSMRAWETPGPVPVRRVPTYEEASLEERLKYTNGYTREREVQYYPRPPSPHGRRQNEDYPRPPSPHGRRQNEDYPRPPSPHGRRQNEQVDQVRFYKEEIAKKDRLITQLTSVDAPRPRSFDTSKIDELYSSDRIASHASIKSENAGLQVKVEGLQSQLRETQVQVEVREEKMRELRIQLETTREEESRQAIILNSLRAKVAEYDAQAGSLEGVATRSEVAILSLQKECSNYQERIMELESRLKQHLDERERAEQDRIMFEKRYSEMVTQISSICQFDGYSSDISPETISNRLKDVVTENAMLRGKMGTMKEHCQTAELETKASRETIMRLVSESDREQKQVDKYTLDMDTLRLERDRAVDRHRELEREVQLLRERLDSTQRAMSSTKRELEERETRFTSVDREIREQNLLARNIDVQYRSFKDTLAQILSDTTHAVEPNEELIRDRVTNLTLAVRDKNAHIDMLEAKLNDLSMQYESRIDGHRSHELKSKRLEVDFLEVQDRLRKYEGDMAAGDMLRDGLRVDKERYLRFLERIVHAMKMEAITMDLGVESITDAIIARSEQLTKSEGDSLVDRKTQIYNLQRKVKSLKEQLESKELHMELLRKKTASFEERITNKSELEREREEEFVKSRKLTKVVDRYKRELNEARLEIRDLKSRLLESSDIRSRTLEQEREIEGLESKVGQLETVRQRQAGKLRGLKQNFDETLHEYSSKKSQVQGTIQALSSELKTTKQSMDELTKRERQLLDLRQVVARMLGMDVNSLAVPDYEIIARLEKLILANQANVSTSVALDTALLDMEDGFRAGYQDASRALSTVNTNGRSRVPARRSINLRTRPRSASPGRRRDTRAY